MLNKNDPLISAVQQVMQQSNTEREAVKTVNEYFGVTDRKALPHERQGEWNAAYQQVLSESNIKHPNQQKLDVHEPEKDQLTAQDFKMLRAKKKTMEEAKTNPYAIGMAAVKKSTGDEPPMEKKNIKKAHEIAKKIMKKKMEEQVSIEAIQEEIAYNLAEQASYVYENYGEEGLLEFYDSLTEEQFDLLSMYESAGAPGGFVQYMQKKSQDKQFKDDMKNSLPDVKLNPDKVKVVPGNTDKDTTGDFAKTLKNAPAEPYQDLTRSDPTNTDSGQRKGAYQPAPPKPKAKPSNIGTAPKQKAKPAQPVQKAQAAPKKKLTFFQKQELRRSAKNDTMDQTRRLEKRYGVKPGSTRSLEEAEGSAAGQSYDAKKIYPGVNAMRNAMYGSNPTPRTVKTGTTPVNTGGSGASPVVGSTTVASRGPETQALSRGAQRMRSGDVAPQPQQGAAKLAAQQRASKTDYSIGNPMGDYNPGQEYSTPTSPKSQAQLNTSPTVKTRPELPAARQKAAPIKVSDTEVMNSPEFKKARQSVGGEAGARKIETGARVQGLGRFNKGDTIMSRTRTMLAAKKNVGRES